MKTRLLLVSLFLSSVFTTSLYAAKICGSNLVFVRSILVISSDGLMSKPSLNLSTRAHLVFQSNTQTEAVVLDGGKRTLYRVGVPQLQGHESSAWNDAEGFLFVLDGANRVLIKQGQKTQVVAINEAQPIARLRIEKAAKGFSKSTMIWVVYTDGTMDLRPANFSMAQKLILRVENASYSLAGILKSGNGARILRSPIPGATQAAIPLEYGQPVDWVLDPISRKLYSSYDNGLVMSRDIVAGDRSLTAPVSSIFQMGFADLGKALGFGGQLEVRGRKGILVGGKGGQVQYFPFNSTNSNSYPTSKLHPFGRIGSYSDLPFAVANSPDGEFLIRFGRTFDSNSKPSRPDGASVVGTHLSRRKQWEWFLPKGDANLGFEIADYSVSSQMGSIMLHLKHNSSDSKAGGNQAVLIDARDGSQIEHFPEATAMASYSNKIAVGFYDGRVSVFTLTRGGDGILRLEIADTFEETDLPIRKIVMGADGMQAYAKKDVSWLDRQYTAREGSNSDRMSVLMWRWSE